MSMYIEKEVETIETTDFWEWLYGAEYKEEISTIRFCHGDEMADGIEAVKALDKSNLEACRRLCALKPEHANAYRDQLALTRDQMGDTIAALKIPGFRNK